MSGTRKEKPNTETPSGHPSFRLGEKVWEFFVGEEVGPRSFAPARVHDPYHQEHTPPTQLVSWWSRCDAWLRYHYTQWRWDVERALARLLRRRWT